MKKLFLLLVLLFPLPAHAEAPTNEAAFDRVLRTKEIRCGYPLFDPYMKKDANTGALSGLAKDYMEALGRYLELKIVWSEEVDWSNYQEGINTGRYDMMCVGVWESGARAKAGLLSRPLYYNVIQAWVRADDTRFNAALSTLNTPEVRITVSENDPTMDIRRALFPKAQEVAQGALTDPSQYFLSVATNKSDAVFADASTVEAYNRQAEVKLKAAADGAPVRRFANSLVMHNSDLRLKFLIDGAIGAINTSGEAEQILAKYGPVFQPIAPDYKE